MIAGHFATALLPAGRLPRTPLWLLFLSAMLPDCLYFLLAFYGVERPFPVEYWTTALRDMHSEMPYSHSLVSILVQTGVMGALAWRMTHDRRATVWCGALVVVHFVCDLLSGFQHEVAGSDSYRMGFNFYNNAPVVAVVVEAAVALLCVSWFVRERRVGGRPLKSHQGFALYAVFLLGSLVFLPIANSPLMRLLSAEP